MSEHSAIEWTDSTFNPWIGCTKISPGCDHCYAARDFDTRKHVAKWGPGEPRVRTSVANWQQPRRWNTRPFYACRECGWRGDRGVVNEQRLLVCPGCNQVEHLELARRRVFCASLADVFDNEIDPGWRRQLFYLIAETPNLDWLLLTKRIGNAAEMIEDCAWRARSLSEQTPAWPWPNVWLGATIVNQEEADRDIPKLLSTPARVRFLSCEPLLGPIDLAGWGSNAVKPEYTTDATTWSEYRWPEWIPLGLIESIQNFWAPTYGRTPSQWCSDNRIQKTPALGAQVGVDGNGWAVPARSPKAVQAGRFVHCWNNIGRIVDDDGSTYHCAASQGPGWLSKCLQKDGSPAHQLHWVIAGGESGPRARPAHPDWIRALRDQCAAARVPFLFKQWGEWAPHSPQAGVDLGRDVRSGRVMLVHRGGETDEEVFEKSGGRSTLPGTRYVAHVGKKTAGRMLEGREHSEFPA